jgi:putative thioredoxin
MGPNDPITTAGQTGGAFMTTIIGSDGAGAAGSGGPPPADLIKDSGIETFEADVLDASMAVPVIVDFWAPWCGPCKQLGPLLEQAVKAARGAVRLVKVDIDQNQELAMQLRVQSVPAVYAFFQGRPIDGFVGALPESQVKAFIDRLVQAAGTGQGPDPLEEALAQAQSALESGQLGAASSLFAQVLQHDPENTKAIAGMIRCRLDSGEIAEAKAMFEDLPDEVKSDPALASVAASLELADMGAEAADVAALKERLAANENDHQARFDLAMAHYAAGEAEGAAGELLEIIRRNRAWNDEAARKQLLKFFEAWGPTDPRTLEARRRLSSMLFS